MSRLRLNSFKTRLLGVFLLLSVLPLSAVGALVYREGEATLRNQLFDRLGSVTLLKSQHIDIWVKERQHDLTLSASMSSFQRYVNTLVERVGDPEGPAASLQLREIMERIRSTAEFAEVFLVEARKGKLLISTDPEQEGKFKADRPYFREGRKGPLVQNIYYSLILEKAVMTFSAPVPDSQGRPVAILVGRVDLRFLDRLMAERAGLGRTGRTFLVNRFNYFVSDSLGRGKYGWQPVFSEGVKQALAGQTGAGLYLNHEKRPVVAAYRWLPDLGVALIAEVDQDEAFSFIHKFRFALIAVLGLVSGVAVLLGMGFSYGISRPVTRLVEAARAIGGGELTRRVDVKGPDELATLASAVNIMADDLLRSRRELEGYSQTLETRVEERTRELATLLEVARTTGSTLDLTEILRRVAREVARLLDADMVGAYMADSDGKVLRPVAGYHVPQALRDSFRAFAIPLKGHRFLEEAWASKKAVFSSAAVTDPRIDRETFRQFPHRSVLFVPVVTQGGPIGGLFAVWWEIEHRFAPEELDLIEGIASQTATAAANACLYEDLARKNVHLQALFETAQRATESLNLADILPQLVRSGAELVGADASSIRLLDPTGTVLNAVTHHGLNGASASVRPLRVGEGVPGRAVRDGRVVVVEDMERDERVFYRDQARAQGVRSMAAVPLRVRDQIIGVLSVYSRVSRRYGEPEVDLLTRFGNLAAIAIRNAQLFDEADRRRREAEGLARVARMLTESLGAEDLAERIAESVLRLFDAHSSNFCLRQPDGSLVAIAWAGAARDRFTPGYVFPPGVGTEGRALAEGRAVWTRDVLEDPGVVLTEDLRDGLAAVGNRAVLAVPVQVKGEIIGVLSVTDRVPRAFSGTEAALLCAFADQAAIALENARLHAAALARVRELATLVKVAQRLTRGLELPEVLESIAGAAAEVFHGEAGFRLVDGEFLVRVGATPGAREAMANERIRIGESLSGQVAATGEPLITADSAADPRIIPAHRSAIRPERTGATMCVPIRVGSRILGTLHIYRERGCVFDQDALTLATSLADQAGIAIENARLYEEAQARLARMKRLTEVSHLVTSSLDLQQVLDSVTASALDLLKGDLARLWIVDEDAGVLRRVALKARDDDLTGVPTSTEFPLGRGLVAWVVEHKTRRCSPNLLEDPLQLGKDWVRAGGYVSQIAVPLIAGERSLGVLIVLTKSAREFSQEEQELLELFAAKAATALENARLYGDLARKNVHLQALFDTARCATESLNLADILPQLAKSAVDLIGVDASSIRLLDRAGAILEAVAHHGVSQTFADRGVVGVGEGSIGQIFLSGQSLAIEDIERDHLYVHREQALAEGIRSAVMVPLRSRDRIIGVLSVYSRAPRRYGEQEVDLLAQFGNLAAIAIENARLLEQLKVHQARLEALLETSRELSKVQPLDSLLAAIAAACGRLLGANSVGIRLVEGDELVGAGIWGDIEKEMPTERLKVGESFSGMVAATGEPLLITDPANDPRLLPAHRHAYLRLGVRAFLGVPIKVGERVAGVLRIRTKREQGFSPEDVAIATVFASQAAIALENARLYRRAEERAEKLTTLTGLTRLITSAPDSREVFNAVSMAVSTLLGAKLARVWVADSTHRVLRVQGNFSFDPDLVEVTTDFPVIPCGQGVVGQIFESRAPEYVADIQQDPRWLNQRLARQVSLHAFAGIPLITGDHVVGVLSMLFGERREFTAEEKELMDLLADQAAITIGRVRLFDELKGSYAEIQRTQEQLVQSEKFRALGEMAGGVAHDFNNLLTAILGRSQYLLLQLDEGEVPAKEARRNLAVVERAALDGAETVRRLLEFTRATPRPGEAVAVDVNELLAQTVEVSRHRWKDEAEAKGIEIQIALEPGDVPAVAGNPAELREVLLNLVFNAIDAMPRGGTVTLSSWREEGTVCVAVQDTGVGIPGEIRQRIFDPFFTTKGPQRSGLGLSACYGILHRHSGEIVVDSTEGKGATFTIKLPILSATARAVETAPSAAGARRLCILIVDDEADVRETLQDVLEAAGHQVFAAASGPDGLEVLDHERMDVILTDLGMPGMTGWEVADRVKARWPELKVGLVTGWGVRVEPEELKAHGVDVLIPKPFQVKQILAWVEALGCSEPPGPGARDAAAVSDLARGHARGEGR